MIKRALAAGASAAAIGYVVLTRRRAGRRRAEGPRLPVAPSQARALVEGVLGRRAQRRQLTIDFEPSTATSWELLIDGPAIFPKMLADIAAATSDVHILIFGFKDGDIGGRMRDLLVRKAGDGLGVRILTEASYSQPGRGSRWRRSRRRGRRARARRRA